MSATGAPSLLSSTLHTPSPHTSPASRASLQYRNHNRQTPGISFVTLSLAMARPSYLRSTATPASLALFVSISVALHGGAVAYLTRFGSLPSAGFLWQPPDAPVEISFEPGLVTSGDEALLAATTTPTPTQGPPTAEPPAPAAPEIPEPAETPPSRDRPSTKEAEPDDAGVPEAPRVPPEAAPERAAKEPTAETATDGPEEEKEEESESDHVAQARALPLRPTGGALFSARLNIQAVRQTPHQTVLDEVLQRLPDVQGLLAGSGVDPLTELDQLWIGSPDLSSSQAMLVGQLRKAGDTATTAALALADELGKDLPVERRGAYELMPWYTQTGPARLLAVRKPKTFVIARDQDLPSVLALQVQDDRDQQGDDDKDHTPFPLLAPPSNALARVDAWGLQHFLRHPDLPVPQTLRLDVGVPNDRGYIRLQGHALLEDHLSAVLLRKRLQQLQQAYVKHPLVQLAGFADTLEGVSFSVQGRMLRMSANLSPDAIAQLLFALRDSLPPPRSAFGPSALDAGVEP